MKDNDFRLYFYDSGILTKWFKYKKHKFKSLGELEQYLESLEVNDIISRKRYQFVAVQYFEPYKSKIVKVY